MLDIEMFKAPGHFSTFLYLYLLQVKRFIVAGLGRRVNGLLVCLLVWVFFKYIWLKSFKYQRLQSEKIFLLSPSWYLAVFPRRKPKLVSRISCRGLVE
jgi:hypothetical protein